MLVGALRWEDAFVLSRPFCCAVDGCRSRATPPSLRFLGRKVYLAAIVVLVAICVTA